MFDNTTILVLGDVAWGPVGLGDEDLVLPKEIGYIRPLHSLPSNVTSNMAKVLQL